ncbi:MAG TPA: ATP-binding cassette domain-containing protein [Gaiella sp.]|uniref:ABC transporter permease subunit n=1 Tax=Gaiella sp. TaxID=2663207 RepID=UPI002D801514|nr:ATP-binding cassette domain-containing protein [Gaiella sp.]HET9289408.1 ATP-binding cassette domain-containing protein [Gaiella sp.]
MRDILLFAALGLGAGALIASIALALVLIYRGSGIINIATGAIAMTGAYSFWAFRTGEFGFQLSSAAAFVLTLVAMAVFGVVIELAIFRPLRNTAPLAKLAASLGLLLVLQSGVVVIFSSEPKSAPSILPSDTITFFGRVVPIDRFMLAGIVIVVAAVLAALYRWTPFGLSTRAASENEVSAMLAGLSPARLSLANTVLASVVAGGLGVLVAPLVTLDSRTMAFQVVPALGAALLAGFTSFFIACFAGLGIGMFQSLLQYWSTQSWFPTDEGSAPLRGLPELFVFLVIVVALFLRGASLPGRGEIVEKRLPAVPRPERLGRWSGILLLAGVVCLIVFPYDFRQALINSLLGILICLSLVVIVGFVGQISVVQLALAGVAGFTMSHLTTDLGGIWAEFPVSLLIGAATATVIGLLIAVSALRVRGVSLVVVTLAAALALEQFGFLNARWGGGPTGSPVTQPELGGVNLGPDASFRGIDDNLPSPVFGFLVLAAAILLALLVANVRRSSLGQRMLAVRSNERAAAASGINVRNTKLAGFGIAAFLAGMAGALYAYNFGSVSYTRFGPLAALGLIAFTYFGGITMISGAIIAGVGATEGLLPRAFDEWLGLSGTWALLVGGIALIVTLLVHPEGIAGAGYTRKQQKAKRLAAEAAASEPRPRVAPVPRRERPARREPGPIVLEATGVSVSFGGLRALDEVDLAVSEGQLVGLIGPNGAGKTTFIDAITGFVPYRGGAELDGKRLDGLPAHARADRGLARTWQSIELFDDLSVRENLAVASYHPSTWATVRETLWRPVTSTKAADEALELLGLREAADATPEDLSQGQRKLVGIARALASEPRLLCLDEPAAGLDAREGEALAYHLRDVVDQGTAMLLIDHDMGLVLGISDYVVVLEFGKVIAHGPPEVVRRDPQVIEAYLGGAASELEPVVDAP